MGGTYPHITLIQDAFEDVTTHVPVFAKGKVFEISVVADKRNTAFMDGAMCAKAGRHFHFRRVSEY